MTKPQQAKVIADEIVTQSVRLVASGRVAPENAAAVKAGMLAVANATIRTFGRYALPILETPNAVSETPSTKET